MFNDVLGLTGQCIDNFCDGVRDSFGASIIADVLDPIFKELTLLNTFNEEFQNLSMEIDQIMQEARSLQPHGSDN